MGRLSATNATEVNAASLRVVRLVKLAFPSGTLYLADTAAPGLTYSSQTYTGDGTLLELGDIEEHTDSTASALRIRLSAGNSTLASRFSTDDWQYSAVEVAIGFLNEAGAFVDTPEPLGSWYMGNGAWSAGVIELYCENAAIDLERVSLVTPSDADQQLRYTGDTFFTNVAALEDKEVEWGGRRMNGRNVVGYGGGNGGGIGSYVTGIPGDAIVNNDLAATASPRVIPT